MSPQGDGLMDRPLRPAPDHLVGCQAYCVELMREIWRLDRRWAQLKATHADADRQGHQLDALDQMRHLEQGE